RLFASFLRHHPPTTDPHSLSYTTLFRSEAHHGRGADRLEPPRRAGQRPHPRDEPAAGRLDAAGRSPHQDPRHRGRPRARPAAPRADRGREAPGAGAHRHRAHRALQPCPGRAQADARRGLGPRCLPRRRRPLHHRPAGRTPRMTQDRPGGQGRGQSRPGRPRRDDRRADHRAQARSRDHQGRARAGSRGRGGPRRGYSASRPAERSPRTTSSREVAYEGLRLVREEDSYANLVLPRLLRSHRLSTRDAGFATELFYGTLRARGRLDAVLAACVDLPLEEVDPALLDVLRVGALPLLDPSVAPDAAPSETVALARSRVGAGAASFANAVLRRVGEEDLEGWLEEVAPDSAADPRGHLAVVHSHPRWVVR